MTLLRLDEVTRTVTRPDDEPLTILSGVDLSVDGGDRVAIVGRSGSGKSTLLNILGLLDAPTTGSVWFDGVEASTMRGARRDRLRGRSIGFVFQQFQLLPGRTALENVEVPLLYASDGTFWRRRAIAADMLDRVGLGHRLDSLPSRLSGGEQQRVAIARSLVRRPRLILADEPTGALDLTTGTAVMALLDEVARSTEAALVTITHDPAIAALSGRTVELRDGRLHPREREAV